MNDLDLFLRFRCEKGFAQRNLPRIPLYLDRMEEELGVIISMGFAGYFLVVSDFLTWARSQGIGIGPGRGSGAGSLVVYCLYITHIDPIKYKLIFERFLNPARVSLPDLDLDFDETRRDEVISYLSRKYGQDNVSHIGTFGSMKAKAAIRAVTRTLEYPYEVGDKLANLVLPPIAGRTQNLQTCYKQVEELEKARHSPQTSLILKWAESFEERIQNFGTHASGIVISDTPIKETIPLARSKDQIVTQWEMYGVEKAGLVKFDLLGLRALTTIDKCLSLIHETTGQHINIFDIPVDDQDVYKQLSHGDTTGVFQLEGSSGITDLLIKLEPTCLEDMSLLVALYRPGPLASGMVTQLLDVRHGKQEPKYLLPELAPILQETGGMIVYQEQVLEIGKQLAGYTLAEADLFRRAVGKKKPEEMEKQRQKFLGGMKDKGFEESRAAELFEQIQAFADYGFNKCLTGETKIKTFPQSKTINQLKESRNYTQIQAFDTTINQEYLDDIVEIIDCGEQEVFEITLSNGIQVECTLEHQFLCSDLKKYSVKEILEMDLDLLSVL